MQTKYKYLLKNTGVLAISSFSSKLMSFFLLPLYTSVLSKTEYGNYDIVVTTFGVLIPLLCLNIFSGVMRFCMDLQYEKEAVFFVGMKYSLISCTIIGCALFIIKIFNALPLVSGFEIYIFFFFVVNVLQQFATNFSKGLEKINDLAVSGILGTAGVLVLNIVFLLVLKLGLKGFYLANIVGSAFVAIYLLFRAEFWKYISLNKHKETEIAMVRYSLPTVALSLGWWVNSSFDKYMVAGFLGTAENGLLSVSYKLPSVINVLYGIFSPAWQISAIKEHGNDDATVFFSTVFSYLSATLCIGCAFVIAFSKPVARVLFAKDFFVAWRYVPFLLLSAVISESAAFFGAILTAKKKTKALAMSTVVGAVVNIILNIVFISLWGTLGATVATIFSSLSIFIYRLRVTEKPVSNHAIFAVFGAWSMLSIQALILLFTDLFVFQALFVFFVIALFLKPLHVLLCKCMSLLGGKN